MQKSLESGTTSNLELRSCPFTGEGLGLFDRLRFRMLIADRWASRRSNRIRYVGHSLLQGNGKKGGPFAGKKFETQVNKLS